MTTTLAAAANALMTRPFWRSSPGQTRVQPASAVEERNSDLFFEIADVLDFYPHLYSQRTYGEFLLPDGICPPTSLGSSVVPDLGLVGVRGCATTACVAGWAAALSGWHPTTNTTFDGKTTLLDWAEVAPMPLTPWNHHSAESVYGLARVLLGITDAEAEELFSGMPSGCSGEHRWTADDLRAIGKGRSVFADEWPGEDFDSLTT
jgi:hypothetical protein